ncbi:MAG: MoxR-like ATPase [Arenicella sp.]|jgi:MoxR-like ATPase
MTTTHVEIKKLQQSMDSAVLGQAQVIEKIIIALLCNGNVLLEGFPGTAKTRCVKVLADALAADMGRVQFTPDLLPSDITGTEVYHAEGNVEKLVFQEGPIFANLILADEINRAPAKVQSALLEAMEERQVTVAGKTYELPELFMVLATQNPIEQEGTYPLPEAQMDRFLLKVNVAYPDDAAELDIVRLVRSEEKNATAKITESQTVKIDQQHIIRARQQIQDIFLSESVENYMVALVLATRHPDRYPDSPLQKWISIGSSPRASISLDKATRAYAWLHGKDFADPDDVRAMLESVLGHRLILTYEAAAQGVSSAQIVEELVRQVAVA